MATDYLDSLSDEDVADINTVLSNFEAVRDKPTGDLKTAVDHVDSLLDHAPSAKGLTFYRNYQDQEGLIGDGSFFEPGFLVGAKEAKVKPGEVSLEFEVSDTPYLDLGDVYILPRNLTVVFSRALDPDVKVPEATDTAYASVVAPQKVVTASMTLWAARNPIEEFYNHAHGRGGKFTSGGGSSSGGPSSKDGGASRSQTRKASIKEAVRINEKPKGERTAEESKHLRKERIIASIKIAAIVAAYIALSIAVQSGNPNSPYRQARGQKTAHDAVKDVRRRNEQQGKKEAAAREEQIRATKAAFKANAARATKRQTPTGETAARTRVPGVPRPFSPGQRALPRGR